MVDGLSRGETADTTRGWTLNPSCFCTRFFDFVELFLDQCTKYTMLGDKHGRFRRSKRGFHGNSQIHVVECPFTGEKLFVLFLGIGKILFAFWRVNSCIFGCSFGWLIDWLSYLLCFHFNPPIGNVYLFLSPRSCWCPKLSGFITVVFNFQIACKLITFGLNSLILRHISKDLLGVVNVRLLLLHTTVLFLCREGIRRACSGNLQKHDWKASINLIWLG